MNESLKSSGLRLHIVENSKKYRISYVTNYVNYFGYFCPWCKSQNKILNINGKADPLGKFNFWVHFFGCNHFGNTSIF